MNYLFVIAAISAIPLLVTGSGPGPLTEAFGANNDICGLQLCSEIEGGRDAWVAAQADESDEDAPDVDIAGVTLPLHKGYYDGQAAYYIITEASERVHADVITQAQGWIVEHVPSLASVPEDVRSVTYMFTNGVRGDGVHGFQSEVFTSVPGQSDYSPLAGHVHVTWHEGVLPKILMSESDILSAAEAGDVELTDLDVVINMPRFTMSPVQSEMLDRAPEKVLRVPLHYGFYDGQKVYNVILESSDKTHSDLVSRLQGLDSVHVPMLADTDAASVSKVYFFTNGIEGPGVHGYQRQVFTAAPGDEVYSPLSTHLHVTWTNDADPRLLTSESSIMAAEESGDVILTEIPIVINMPLLSLDASQIMDLPKNFAPFDAVMDSMMQEEEEGMMAQEEEGMMAQEEEGMMAQEETAMEEPQEMKLRLSRANVAVDIPLHKGYYEGNDVYYVITDTNNEIHAGIITELQDWRVEMAPFLGNAPDAALSTTYMFTNGVEGDGIHGFQNQVFTSTPEQADTYSALAAQMHVTWADSAAPRILDSEAAIMEAADAGEVSLDDIGVVINMPHIVWPGGQMMVKEDTSVDDETPYGGGQVLGIDTEEMTVTFVAHRGWGPDGRTIYYIVTDATPSGPANMMGVVSADTSAALIANSAAVDLYQFANGIAGSGPLGFQPGIASSALGDAGYSPMWRIYIISWNDPADASLLETIGDIQAYLEEGLITASLARPMDSDHIVNCPFIDPFQ